MTSKFHEEFLAIMPATASVNPYAKNSAVKAGARATLTLMQRVLPARAYSAIYEPAFAAYQRILLDRYRRKYETALKSLDDSLIDRTKTVLRMMPHSLIGAPGLEHTYDQALATILNSVEGAFVECGVARGGCAALLAHVATQAEPKRHCWFFDSFEGLPDPTDQDIEDGRTGDHIRPLPKGACLGTIEQVSSLLFEEFGYDRDKVTLVKGWFQDTLPMSADRVGPIAMLRVDGDWFDSTYCVLREFYDLVSIGGVVVIDDYWSCHGARKATDQFLSERGVNVGLSPDGRGGMSFVKPPCPAA